MEAECERTGSIADACEALEEHRRRIAHDHEQASRGIVERAAAELGEIAQRCGRDAALKARAREKQMASMLLHLRTTIGEL